MANSSINIQRTRPCLWYRTFGVINCVYANFHDLNKAISHINQWGKSRYFYRSPSRMKTTAVVFFSLPGVLCEGNRRPLVDSPSQKEGNGVFCCFFSVVSLNNILKKQSSCPLFQAPWRPSDVTVMQREVMNKFHISNFVKISMWSQSLSICVLCTCKLPMLFMAWQVLSVSIQCFTLGLNWLRPRRDRRHFADDSFKCVFLNENEWISLRISLKFVPKVRNNNIPSLVQIMAWRRPGDKPLSEPMVVSLPTHICVTRPQWVYSI